MTHNKFHGWSRQRQQGRCASEKRFVEALLAILITAFGNLDVSLADVISPPAIQWQRSDGGDRPEEFWVVQQVADGGYLLAGHSSSGATGNKTNAAFRWEDVWLVKLDSVGNKLWERTFGGSNNDYAYSVVQTADDGFLIGGASDSGTNGNKTSENFGMLDFWVLRLDASGQKAWERSFGGNAEDRLRVARQTTDGGFVLGGYSYSGVSGNKTNSNFGSADMWLVRLDAQGQMLWQREFGGGNIDVMLGLDLTSDGGFVLGGYTYSQPSGNKTASVIGGQDFWAVRVDSNGNKLWDRTYGGTDHDLGGPILQTADGGFLFAGNSLSGKTGTKSQEAFGSLDIWIAKLDAHGNQVADWAFGGTDYDVLYDLEPTDDGGFVLGASSLSTNSATKTSDNIGSSDYWVIRLDSEFKQIWDQCFGGTNGDGLASIQQTRDGGFIMGGTSWSLPSGNKTSPRWDIGLNDYWVLKLAPDALTARPRLRTVIQSNEQLRTNGFQLFLTGHRDLVYAVEFSTNFVDWTSFRTNQSFGLEIPLIHKDPTNAAHQFYRARWLQ